MRTLTDHQVNPANDKLNIVVTDAPGPGNANHEYIIRTEDYRVHTHVFFQNGPINEVGVNGLTHEALLAILADRLRCFQSGKFANLYNEQALHHVESALANLKARTIERMQRGVEGTHTV